MPSGRDVRRVRCRIADVVRSYNLFPLPEGEGNHFFVLGRWLRGIVADKGGGAHIGPGRFVMPASPS